MSDRDEFGHPIVRMDFFPVPEKPQGDNNLSSSEEHRFDQLLACFTQGGGDYSECRKKLVARSPARAPAPALLQGSPVVPATTTELPLRQLPPQQLPEARAPLVGPPSGGSALGHLALLFLASALLIVGVGLLLAGGVVVWWRPWASACASEEAGALRLVEVPSRSSKVEPVREDKDDAEPPETVNVHPDMLSAFGRHGVFASFNFVKECRQPVMCQGGQITECYEDEPEMQGPPLL